MVTPVALEGGWKRHASEPCTNLQWSNSMTVDFLWFFLSPRRLCCWRCELKDRGLPRAMYHNVSHHVPSLNPLEGLSMTKHLHHSTRAKSLEFHLHLHMPWWTVSLFPIGHGSQNSIPFHSQKKHQIPFQSRTLATTSSGTAESTTAMRFCRKVCHASWFIKPSAMGWLTACSS